jgi:hypothetical protein
LVTRCHGAGGAPRLRAECAAPRGPGRGEPGALERFSGDSGDALVLV